MLKSFFKKKNLQSKRTHIILEKIYGIGKKRSKDIFSHFGITKNCTLQELYFEEISKIDEFIKKKYKINKELSLETKKYIKKMINIKSYKGLRHLQGYPVRGQRTHSNSKTQRKFKIK